MLSSSAVHRAFAGGEVRVADLTGPEGPLRRFIEGCDVVVHSAGEIRDPGKMKALHIDGTGGLLRAAASSVAQGRPLHWVQLSSVGLYGPPAKPGMARILTELDAENPLGKYEQTKACSDRLVEEASRQGIITHTIVRPSIVFGVDMPNTCLRLLARVVRSGFFSYWPGHSAVDLCPCERCRGRADAGCF